MQEYNLGLNAFELGLIIQLLEMRVKNNQDRKILQPTIDKFNDLLLSIIEND